MLDFLYLYTFVGTLLVLTAVFSSLVAFRFGTPVLLLFLAVGLLAGEDGLGIAFNDAGVAYGVGSLALALILFDSGFGTPIRSFRVAAAPAITLATAGVLLTALLFAIPARYILDFTWPQAALLGAIVSSTDAAAVFFLLRVGGISIRDRVRSTLEIESGSNDPMAVFLTIAIAEFIRTGPDEASGLAQIASLFAQQMLVGVLGGLLGGMLIVYLVNRLRVDRGLLPIFVLALSLLVFALTGVAGGSAFLAVYLAGLYAGNQDLPALVSTRRFQEGLTWLAQIVMFLLLGLYATPSSFDQVALPALALALFLMLVARPVSVWLCLLPFRFTRRETAFVGWVGLRGAVSILLAIVPLLYQLPASREFFNAAFIIVLVSLVIQGWTISPVARMLGLVVPPRRGAVDKVELELPGTTKHELLVYRVLPDSPVAQGERVPRWARPSLVVRDGRSMTFANAGHLQAGDMVYLFVSPRYPPLLDRLFALPVPVQADDADIYGEFPIDIRRTMGELAEVYGLSISTADSEMTIGEFMMSRLGASAWPADRVPVGEIDLIVRETDEKGAVATAGMSLTHQEEAIHSGVAGWIAALRERIIRLSAGLRR